MKLQSCRLIDFQEYSDFRGSLTVMEYPIHLPFKVNRAYFLHDVPNNVDRGAHAHRSLHQIIFAIHGSFDIVLDDGISTQKFRMDASNKGIYICPMIWRVLSNFSAQSVCMVLASETYSEDDYIRNHEEFVSIANSL